MSILVTGGAGYIGSHTVLELLNADYEVVVIDNLINSSREAINRVKGLAAKDITFYQGDVSDGHILDRIFTENYITAVIHFAALKSVGQSVQNPLYYYRNNLDSTLRLCEKMEQYEVKKLIFSSSATVYGHPSELPLKETSRVGIGITNPYGQTKFMIEQILTDVVAAHTDWQVTTLRYFNPVGAHESGQIGEDPNGVPNNLLPYIAQVAVGRLKRLQIYGGDYATSDGTGVRDYIHVVDLAKGHLAALKYQTESGLKVYNLGSGKGSSVLEALQAFEKASGSTIPYEITTRRPGDVAECFADATLAAQELLWHTEKDIEQACIDAWKWQSQNPNGYKI